MYPKKNTLDIGSNASFETFIPSWFSILVVVIIFAMHSNQLIEKEISCVHNFNNLWELSKDLGTTKVKQWNFTNQNVSSMKTSNYVIMQLQKIDWH